MSIYRVYGAGEYRTMTAQAIADGLNTPVAIRKMDLQTLFASIIGAAAEGDRQAVAADLRPLMKESATVDMVTNAITTGDLAGLRAILMLLAGDFGPATTAAINAVVQAITVTAGVKFWNEEDGEIPDPFTAEWVTTTLEAAGYTWTGTEWARA